MNLLWKKNWQTYLCQLKEYNMDKKEKPKKEVIDRQSYRVIPANGDTHMYVHNVNGIKTANIKYIEV